MKFTDRMYLYGAGGHSKVVTDVLHSCGVSVAGIFDDDPPGAKLRIMEVRDGIRLLGEGFPTLDAPLIITVGHNGRRAELAAALGATYGNAIHGSAIIAPTVSIGTGTMVLHGAILQADAQIGTCPHQHSSQH